MDKFDKIEQLGLESKEEINTNMVVMTTDELQDFVKYIRGDVVNPPDVIGKMNANIRAKLIAGQSYYIFNQMGKIPGLLDFMKKAEDKIYDPNAIQSMNTDELLKIYDKAQSTVITTMEYGRRFYAANKGNWKELEERQDIAKQMLGGLPDDEMDALIDIVSTGKLKEILEAYKEK